MKFLPILSTTFLLLRLVAVNSAAEEIHVGAYGALPDDGVSDREAVQAALEAARGVESPVLVFDAGRYDFDSIEDKGKGLIDIRHYPSIAIRGNGTELVGQGLRPLFLVRNCGEITVSEIMVDWDPLPYTAGEVVQTGDDYCDVRIAEGHPLLEEPIESIFAVEPESKAFTKSGSELNFRLGQRGYAKASEVVEPGVLRMYRMPEPHSISSGRLHGAMPAVGTQIVAYYNVRGGGAFQIYSCTDVTISNVEVYSAPGMGFMINNCEADGEVLLIDTKVIAKPGAGRWKSVTADGTHFNMNRGAISVINCTIEDVGDDGANVHASYNMVHEKVSPDTIVARGWMNPFVHPGMKEEFRPPNSQFRVGDMLEFSTDERRHVSAFEARIVESSNISVDGKRMRRIRLDRELPAFIGEGTVIANASEVAEFLMRDCTMRRIRGQGVRVKTRNAIVEDSLFEDIQANGIWIFCDADYGRESISAKNVIIRGSTFTRAIRAVRSSAGRQEPIDHDVHENILIEDCIIEDCGSTPILLYSVKDVVIRNNIFDSGLQNPIQYEYSSNVRIDDGEQLP